MAIPGMIRARTFFLLGCLAWLSVWFLRECGFFVGWEQASEAGLKPVASWVQPALIGLAAFGVAWTTLALPDVARRIFVALCACAELYVTSVLASWFGYDIPFVAPICSALLAFLGGSLCTGSLQGRHLREFFALYGGHASPEGIRRLASKWKGSPEEVRQLQVAMLDCRISEGASDASAHVPVTQLALERFRHLVFAGGGCVEHLGGSGLRALFFDPLTPGNPTGVAIQTALRFFEALPAPDALRLQIGIETDDAAVGPFGPRGAAVPSVAGDLPLFTSRLAALNSRMGTRVLLGPSAQASAGSEWAIRPVGLLPADICREGAGVLGEPPLEVFEPLGDSLSEERREACALFWKGIVLLRRGDRKGAAVQFAQAQSLLGPDPLCASYLGALGGETTSGPQSAA